MNEPTSWDNLDQLNFLPSWYVRKRVRRRAVKRQTLLVTLVVAGLALAAVETDLRLNELRLYHESLANQVKMTKHQITEVSKLQSEKRELVDKVKIHRRLYQPVSYSQIISTLASIVPAGIVFDDLELKTETERIKRTVDAKSSSRNARRPGVTKARTVTETYEIVEIKITGHAPADVVIANFIGKLAESGLFQKVKMVYAKQGRVDRVSSREFLIQMRVPLNVHYLDEGESEIEEAGEVADAH